MCEAEDEEEGGGESEESALPRSELVRIAGSHEPSIAIVIIGDATLKLTHQEVEVLIGAILDLTSKKEDWPSDGTVIEAEGVCASTSSGWERIGVLAESGAFVFAFRGVYWGADIGEVETSLLSELKGFLGARDHTAAAIGAIISKSLRTTS